MTSGAIIRAHDEIEESKKISRDRNSRDRISAISIISNTQIYCFSNHILSITPPAIIRVRSGQPTHSRNEIWKACSNTPKIKHSSAPDQTQSPTRSISRFRSAGAYRQPMRVMMPGQTSLQHLHSEWATAINPPLQSTGETSDQRLAREPDCWLVASIQRVDGSWS